MKNNNNKNININFESAKASIWGGQWECMVERWLTQGGVECLLRAVATTDSHPAHLVAERGEVQVTAGVVTICGVALVRGGYWRVRGDAFERRWVVG